MVLLFQRKTETQASFIQILYFFGTTIDPVRAFEKMRERRERVKFSDSSKSWLSTRIEKSLEIVWSTLLLLLAFLFLSIKIDYLLFLMYNLFFVT